MRNSRTISLNNRLSWRCEYFGVFIWAKNRSEYFRLDGLVAAIFAVVAYGARIDDYENTCLEFKKEGFEVKPENIKTHIRELISSGILTTSEITIADLSEEEPIHQALKKYLSAKPTKRVAKPIWAHLQPFTFCNLACIHCYCLSSPNASKMQLSTQLWCQIIRKLDNYGIGEVFITGGETLLIPEIWTLIEEISNRSLGTGLSTNALHITQKLLDKLKYYKIPRIQVSIDGAKASTHDYLRNHNGAFAKTIRNIEKISHVSEPVINTVVNQINFGELEQIIRIGKELGVQKFKFLPQKPTGRAKQLRDITLNNKEIIVLNNTCEILSNQYKVVIETLDLNAKCGAAHSGFSINEFGNVYPCIFGIGDPEQNAGNILELDIDQIWFESTVMRDFRIKDCQHPCRRCESG